MSNLVCVDPKWTPSPAVTTHAGNPIPDDMIFFALPPKEIGTIISASSTAHKGKLFRPISQMWLILGGIIVATVVLGLILNASSGVEPIYKGAWLLWLPIIGIVCFFKFGYRYFPTSFECTFVGDQGWARESIDEKSQIQKTHLQYDQSLSLFTEIMTFKSGFLYTGTWLDAQSKEIGKIKERADSHGRLPSDGHVIHFTLAAEHSWTRFITPVAINRLLTTGSIIFPIKVPDRKGDYSILLTSNRVCVRYVDTNMDLGFSELEPNQGYTNTGGKSCFIIRKKDVEKHAYGQTTVTIEHSEVTNVQLLLNLLQLGIEGKLLPTQKT